MYVRKLTLLIVSAAAALSVAACGAEGGDNTGNEQDVDVSVQEETSATSSMPAPSPVFNPNNGVPMATAAEGVSDRDFDPKTDAENSKRWEDIALEFASVFGRQSSMGDKWLEEIRPYVTDGYFSELERVRPAITGTPTDVYVVEELRSKKIVRADYPGGQYVYFDLVMPVGGSWLVNAHEQHGVAPANANFDDPGRWLYE